MNQTYEIGLDANEISIQVTAGTTGVAYTRVDMVKPGGATQTIAESDINSGNVRERNIGAAGVLRNNYIVITTNLDFSHIPADQRQAQVEHMVIQYAFKGGLEGDRVYVPDADDIVSSPDYSIVTVTKAIQLI
jgi:hypothetical protein